MSYVLLGAMFVHFIGDFVMQSNYVASRKSKEFNILLAHVAIYTLVMALALILYTQLRYGYGPNIAIPLWFKAIGLVFISHLGIDFVTSRITSIVFESAMNDYKFSITSLNKNIESDHLKSFGNKYHEYFVVIGFDQFLHFLSLWLIIELLPIV
jgi:hypothetical protein